MGVVDTFVNSEEESVNKDESVLVVAGAKFGAEDEIRTRDILLGKEVQRAQHPLSVAHTSPCLFVDDRTRSSGSGANQMASTMRGGHF